MEMLVARNVLVFRIDGSRHWLRMHTLLRQFLQAEAQRKLGASNQRAVCKAAATYFAEHGEAVTAIDYALEGSALELASTLLDRIARKVPTGRDWRSRYLAWAEHLMAAGMPLSLTAHSWYAWALCFSNAHERARWSTERLLERLALEEDVPHELQTRAGLLQVLNAVFLDRVEEARCAATSWLAEDRPRDAFDRAMVAGASVIAALARRDDDGACQSLLVAQSAVASRPDSYGHVWVMILTACQHLDAGEPRQADALLRPVRDTALRNFGPEADVIDTLDLVHARVALDLGDVAAARERVLRGMASATRHGIIETVLHGLATCVVLAELPDSPPALRPAAQDAVAMTYPPRARRLLAAMRVRLLACGGKLDEAHVLGRRAGLWVQARRHADLDREGIGVTLAQLELLAHEQPAKALVWIDKLTREAPMRYLVRESVALYLLSASIHQRAGEARRALRQFSLALVLAARRGLLSPFDERPGLIAFLFAKFAVRDFGFTHPDEIDLLEQLSERWGLVGGASAQQIGGESLTPRERDLLDMLACGLSNQQIADRLALSVTTVKWHCSNLYGKLGVRSRSAAVTRARHQGQLRDAA
jgi:LuxR family transcriptional regulator, maltose regulon positive regulatory protein